MWPHESYQIKAGRELLGKGRSMILVFFSPLQKRIYNNGEETDEQNVTEGSGQHDTIS